ncbi:hypothetical protein [Pelagibius sp.]|uniref:hypothetical protein n=1 Tax=Pelagibius sp. TaxID=1931238 RepID=UPI003B511AB1
MIGAALWLPLPALAADTAEDVIAQARADCRSFEGGTLTLGENAIVPADLTGDGEPEEIVDSRAFTCSSAASLFCGTGGCTVTVVVDGAASAFLAKAWRIVDWNGQPILLLAVHGSDCGGTNLRRCYEAVVWSEDGFRSLRPEP